jgi:chromosome segregation ATPase
MSDQISTFTGTPCNGCSDNYLQRSASRRRVNERAKTLRRERERLESVVAGHRDMAASHESSIEELAPKAKAHREAAADHAERAEKLEDRIERERRQAQFHAERAGETEDERGRI